MTLALELSDLERFRRAIGRLLGLQFDDSRLGFLANVLARRAESTGLGEKYLPYLEGLVTGRRTGRLIG